MKNKIIKLTYIFLSLLLITPSIIHLVNTKTIMGENIYFNFFLNNEFNKNISTIIFIILYICITFVYFAIYKIKPFNNIKEILEFVTIIGIIFIIMLPWTSSDIFYYMGVGELDAIYYQNPYYINTREFYQNNIENIEDELLQKGAENYWGNTTVVYGPIAQTFFKIASGMAMKKAILALFIFKLINLIIHISNTFIIFNICKKKSFAILYGLNPFILIEALGNVHNDILVIFFVLISLYFLLKKRKLIISIIFLALATCIKYFTVLLLPVFILYHFRNEKNLLIRFIKCIQYGIVFLLSVLIMYIPYLEDFNPLLSMIVQTERYSGSIYSAIMLDFNNNIMNIVRTVFITAFLFYYIIFCIDLLTEKNIKFYRAIRKYSFALCLFLLILTNFHPWYLMWLFPTFIWMKANTIKNIIGISICTEIANSVYMILFESYKFDNIFIRTEFLLFIIWVIITNKNIKILKRIEKKIIKKEV